MDCVHHYLKGVLGLQVHLAGSCATLLRLHAADAVHWRGLHGCFQAAGVAGVWCVGACLLQHNMLLSSSFISLLCGLTNVIISSHPQLPSLCLPCWCFTDGDKMQKWVKLFSKIF